MKITAVVMMLCLGIIGGGIHPIRAQASDSSYDIIAPYSRSAGPMVFEMAREHARLTKAKSSAFVSVGAGAVHNLNPMWDKDEFAHGLIVNQWPTHEEQREYVRHFPNPPRPMVYWIGERRLAVVVHPRNPLESIRLTDIHQILGKPVDPSTLSDESKEWPPLPVGVPSWSRFAWRSVTIRPVTEGPGSWSREILRYRALRRTECLPKSRNWGNLTFRTDLVECLGAEEVLDRVRKDASAIGFFQYTGSEDFKGVKLLAVEDDFPSDWPVDLAAFGPVPPANREGRVEFFAPENWFLEQQKGPVALRLGKFMQPDYPFSEPLLLFIHPHAKDSVKSFAEFCVSAAGSEGLARRGFVTPRDNAHSEADERVRLMEQGQGERVQAAGGAQGTFLMRDLAIHYTRNHAVVRISYAAKKEEWAVGDFLNEKELLLLSQPVESLQLNPILKQKWDEANQERQLTMHRIGGRGVAVVVHSLNRLSSLTIGQLQSIFSGRVQDWRALAAFDEQATDTAIRCYGLDARDPTFALFYQKIDARDSGRLHRKKDAQEILSAVAMDPQAIGFVNIADLPEDPRKMGLRILAIDGRTGRVLPTAGAVLDGSYPISEFLYLYVHSRATRETRKFVDWLLVPGEFTTPFNTNGFVSTPIAPTIEVMTPSSKTGE